MESNSRPEGVEALAEEFLERRRRGERPTVSEFVERFPELADEIRDLFPALDLMEEVRPETTGASRTASHADRGADRARIEQLGEFRILREIGRGGMGIVYEAEQLSLGRRVALKVLPAHAVLEPRHLHRFQREARAAARLHHTNIVPVFGVGECDHLHYYVMQFIPGQGLDKVLEELRKLRVRQPASPAGVATGEEPGAQDAGKDCGKLPADGEEAGAEHEGSSSVSSASSPLFAGGGVDSSITSATRLAYCRGAAKIGVQVADALEYAAVQGVLHRDIKPSNLLLDAHGNVWVTDFGLAKTEGQEELTQSGDLIGTLRYMAPERLRGQCDIRSDVYGLGLTLYELLTTRPAFDERDKHRLLRQIADADPPALDKADPSVPRDLITIVEKAIAKLPAHRYSSAGAMAEDLRRFLDDRPIQARRVGGIEQAWRWCRRNPTVASLVSAVFILTSAAVLFAIQASRKQEAAREAERKQYVASLVGAETSRQADEAKIVADFLAREVIFEGSAPHGHTTRSPCIDALEDAETRIPAMFKDKPLAEATLRFRLGKSYFRIGELGRAYEHLSRAVELRRKLHGADHQQTLEATDFLALVLRDMGRLADARKLREEMMAAILHARGPNDPEAHEGMLNLMSAYKDAGDLERARSLCQEIIAAQLREHGEDDARTLNTQEELALVLRTEGKRDEARQLLQKVLDARIRIAGPKDRRTLLTKTLLAILLKDENRLDQALDLATMTLETQRQLLGEKDGDTLFTACNVALVLRLLGRKDEARAVCDRTLETGHCFFVSEQPDSKDSSTLDAVEEFIDAFEKEGNLPKAEILARELLAVSCRFFGWDHPRTIHALERVVSLLERQGKTREVADLRRGVQVAKSLGS